MIPIAPRVTLEHGVEEDARTVTTALGPALKID